MQDNFGSRLKEVRIKNKITLRELAKILDVNFSTISRWENGEISPSIDNLKNICDYFDISADYLIGRID